jgi:hypothetical protein
MKRRAKVTLPPAAPGTPDDGEPIDQRDHFIRCPICHHMIDTRDPAECDPASFERV